MSETKATKKLGIDQNLCIGCGLCVSMCPECFGMGDDERAYVKKESCEGCNLDDTVDDCPVGAISYE